MSDRVIGELAIVLAVVGLAMFVLAPVLAQPWVVQ